MAERSPGGYGPSSVIHRFQALLPHLAELRRIGDETVAAGLPPEARDEAWRAWINLIIRAMVGSRL
jgi:hypothetical protein